MAGMGRRRRGLKGLVAFVSLAVSLFVGEAWARRYTDAAPPVLVRDAVVGRRFLRSFEGAVWDKEAMRRVPLRFNELGFRGPEWSEAKPDGTRRLSILGDSMVAAVMLEEPRTCAGVLEERLNERGTDTWQVMNWGVPGSSTCQELTLFRDLVSRYDNDVVVLGYYAGNDLTDNSRRLTGNPRIYYDLDENGELLEYKPPAAMSTVSTWLNRNSRLYVWQKLVRKGSKEKSPGGRLHSSDFTFREDGDPDLEHAWSVTRAVIAALRDEVERAGAELVVAMIPCAEQVYPDAYELLAVEAERQGVSFDRDYPARRLESVCAELGARFHSLAPRLREAAAGKTLADEEDWLFFGGRGHWNAHGQALGAESLLAYLEAEGLLGSAGE